MVALVIGPGSRFCCLFGNPTVTSCRNGINRLRLDGVCFGELGGGKIGACARLAGGGDADPHTPTLLFLIWALKAAVRADGDCAPRKTALVASPSLFGRVDRREREGDATVIRLIKPH